MREYYSNDSNYQTLSGTVAEVYDYTDQGFLLEIEITSDSPDFTDQYADTVAVYRFELFASYLGKEAYEQLMKEDNIIFQSAHMVFYNDHVWPMVSLESESTCYLTFEEGKANLLKWVENYSVPE